MDLKDSRLVQIIAKLHLGLVKVATWASAAALVVMALVSLFTGFKVNFLPFKLCPAIFGLSAVLFILGAAL